jgi:hypothetical protein
MLEFLFKSNIIFTSTRSSGARLGEVQAHQTRQLTLNMLEFLFKFNLIFTTTESSGARLEKVQAHQMRQFSLNMLQFLFKSEFFSPLWTVQER